MIGVSVQPSEEYAARELFELCKTPWEFYRVDHRYEVVLCTTMPRPTGNCRLILFYSARSTPFDIENRITPSDRMAGISLVHAERRFPLYGDAATFPGSPLVLVKEEATNQSVLFAHGTSDCTVVRVGFNLFDEIHHLLTDGQPAENARIPTLDFHLAMLRDLITRAGIPLIEIPPIPEGYAFMTCLTHDIDHPVLKNHRLDHTMFGFLQKATIGSFTKFIRGRLSFGLLVENWTAALKLPLIHLGMAKDLWRRFAHDYLQIESGLGATYFVIPERDNPGIKADGSSAPMRACRYEIADLLPQLKALTAAGNEIGVHGLDAWRDADAGRREKIRVSQATNTTELGIRMHWLYFSQNSPTILDEAGYSYDSTVGYNETVGYRAGTTQVYQPPATLRLLELPLHVMDTALFYPTYLNLDEESVYRLVSSMIRHMTEFGGALTFNWHDRSLAPDRLWGNIYIRLIQEMKNQRAWFPTAGEAVAWFRKRRRAAIELIQIESGRIRVRAQLDQSDALPGLKIRIYHPLSRPNGDLLATGMATTFSDERFDKLTEINLR